MFGHASRFIKVQVDLLDTYRTVHKAGVIPQIFIRPELYGNNIDSKELSDEVLTKFAKFFVRECEQKNHFGKLAFNGIDYNLYTIPESPLSPGLKACVI